MDLDLSKRSKPCFKKNRMMSMGKVKNPFLKLCGIGLLTVICISVKAQYHKALKKDSLLF